MGPTSRISGLFSKFRTFDTLRYNRNFRFLWTSNLCYQLGWWMSLLVMAWLAYELTGSVFLVGVFTAVRLFPTFLGPFTGTIADRVNRRKLLMTLQALQATLAIILGTLIVTGQLQFWQLTAIGFLQGVIWSMFYTTSYSLFMDIVGKENITNAVALNIIAMNVTRVIGPALGGVLIAALGPANCFWLVVGFNIFAITSLTKLKTPVRAAPASANSAWRDIAEGFKYVIHHRPLLSVLAVSFTANIFLWPAYQTFMPIFAKDNLGLGPDGLGLLMTAMGVGALISAVIIASMGNFKWKGRMYLGGTAIMAIFFGTFALSRVFPVAITLFGLAGLASTSFCTMLSTLTLTMAPEDMRGRCMGFLQMAIGVYCFGSIAMGAIANIYGVGPTTAVSCAILLALMITYAIVFPGLRRME